MARPGLAARSRDQIEALRPEYPMRYRTEPAQTQRPTLPPRIGAGTRPRRPATRSDGLLLWRVLGVSAAALIFGMGGLLAYHLVSPPAGTTGKPAAQAGAAAAPVPSPAGPVTQAAPKDTTSQITAQATPPQDPAVPLPSSAAAAAQSIRTDAGAGEAALKVASVLGAAEPAGHPAPTGPTEADFSRPAFLEPIGDAADDDATLPAGAVETVAEGPPPDAVVPLPVPRPSRMAAADAATTGDDATASARIRSAVTLRSGPRRSASAIGTLAAGTRVKLYSCKSWCEVATGDKRGWVYKSAVDQ